MHKAPYVIPLVGGRKIEQLQDNIKALSISLSDKQIKFLESQAPFDPGFPHNMIVRIYFNLLYYTLNSTFFRVMDLALMRSSNRLLT